jgi:hypothetical protein
MPPWLRERGNAVKNVNIAEDVQVDMRTRSMCIAFAILLVLSAVPVNLSHEVSGDNSAPTFTRFGVTPRIGPPNIEYLFTATYQDPDNDAPSGIKVFIDQVGYELEELDPTDTNYSDGKDYFFKIVLSQGTYTFYFTCQDGNGNEYTAPSYSLEVTWDVGHYDLIHYFEEEVYPGILMILTLFIVVIFILCFAVIIMALQMRKIGRALEGSIGKEAPITDKEDREQTQ